MRYPLPVSACLMLALMSSTANVEPIALAPETDKPVSF